MKEEIDEDLWFQESEGFSNFEDDAYRIHISNTTGGSIESILFGHNKEELEKERLKKRKRMLRILISRK